MNITPWRERADCDWQAEIDELRASAATDAHLLELAQDTAKRLCDELAALKAQPVQPVKQADHSELVRELRYVADWAQHHLDKAQIINAAADALEGVKP